MKECPTRVRTGVPPSRVTSSGTAREVIRLWITVEPGSRASSREAISAVTTDGLTISPRSSTRKQRSASPSKASPMSAPVSAHLRLQVGHVGGLDGVRLVVREGAVEVVVQRHDVEVQPAEHRRCGVPGHPVAGVDDHPEPAPGHRGEGQQVGGVLLEHVALDDRARPLRDGRLPRRDQVADGGQAGVRAERDGVGTAHLDAVVLRRVVARGEHRAGHAQAARGEVQLVGGGQADQRDVGPGGGGAVGEGAGQPRRRGPHVVADDDRAAGGPGDGDEGGPDGAGELLVDLVGDGAPHVVRLEHGSERGGVGGGHGHAD